MLAPSPVLNDSALPTLTIKVDGKVFDSDGIVSVEVWNRINRLPRARLVVNDGDPSTEMFALSQSDTFLPGSEVTIAAGYGDDSTTIFSGVIVKHGLDVMPNAPPRLVVEMTDHAMKMTLQRKNAVFKQKSDHDVVAALVSANGLTAGTNDAPSTRQDAIVQYHASDWDLLVTRAEANGLLVIVAGKRVDVVAPDTSANPVLVGRLRRFDARLRSRNRRGQSAFFGGGQEPVLELHGPAGSRRNRCRQEGEGAGQRRGG